MRQVCREAWKDKRNPYRIFKSGFAENKPGYKIKILKCMGRGKHFMRAEIDGIGSLTDGGPDGFEAKQ
jgi:hypothetical protein